MKIGITGSLASGKTTASKILAKKRGPLFSADSVVKDLYRNPHFKSLVSKTFKIKNNKKIKSSLKKIILDNKKNIRSLENIIHPLVRKKMKNFSSVHKRKKFIFYEIPLLVESKLMKFFNVIIFIKANRKIRLKRFKSKSGDEKLFKLLDSKQFPDKKKTKICDHVVVNEKNLKILKRNLLDIFEKYE